METKTEQNLSGRAVIWKSDHDEYWVFPPAVCFGEQSEFPAPWQAGSPVPPSAQGVPALLFVSIWDRFSLQTFKIPPAMTNRESEARSGDEMVSMDLLGSCRQ